MNHSEYPSVTARTAKESLFRCGRGGVAAAAGWLTQPFWPCRIESPTGMNLEPSAEANEGKNRSSCLWGIHFSPPALGLNPSLSDSTKTCDFLPPPLSRSIIQHHHATTDTKTLTTFPPPPPLPTKVPEALHNTTHKSQSWLSERSSKTPTSTSLLLRCSRAAAAAAAHYPTFWRRGAGSGGLLPRDP